MSTKTAITVTRQTKGQITDVLVGVFTCGFHLLCCPFSRLIISIK